MPHRNIMDILILYFDNTASTFSKWTVSSTVFGEQILVGILMILINNWRASDDVYLTSKSSQFTSFVEIQTKQILDTVDINLIQAMCANCK